MRLIDADELKKHAFSVYQANGLEFEPLDVVPVASINNAPTVKFSLMPADETKEDAYKRGYKKGKVVGILKANKRPQGEWIVQPHSMIMKCSLCGNEENAKDVGTINPDKHFCSFCGADMRKGGKEE